MALLASSAEAAQEAERLLRRRYDFVEPEEAEMVLALGGDGFLLQTLHEMLASDRLCPVFGMNLGTVGFLMNEWQIDGLVVDYPTAFYVRDVQISEAGREGAVVGVLAVHDPAPRVWTDDDAATLQQVAASVVAELELAG